MKTELIAPITAASRAAITNPTSPVGSRFSTSVGYAKSGFLTLGSGNRARQRNDAGQHQHEDRQDLEEAGEDRARFRVAFIARRKHALHDHLVGTPIPYAQNWRPEEDTSPRETGDHWMA